MERLQQRILQQQEQEEEEGEGEGEGERERETEGGEERSEEGSQLTLNHQQQVDELMAAIPPESKMTQLQTCNYSPYPWTN